MKGEASQERPIGRGGRVEAPMVAEWPAVRLDDVAVTSSGGTPPRSRPDYFRGAVPWARIEDLTRNGMWLRTTEERITEAATHETNAKVFPARTVLVAMYGSIGTTSIAALPVSCNQAILGCECGPDLHPEYLYYWFSLVRRRLLARGRGGTQANLNAGIVNALSIPLPPLVEQERIAARLTEQLAAVERARAAAQARLAAAEALPAAYLREVFEGPEASGWDEVALGELLRTPIRTGISKPGRPGSSQRCLTLSAVRGRTLLLEASKPAEVSDAEAIGAWLRPGCFYVVRGNGNRELVGRGAFAPDPVPRPILFPDLLFQIDLCDLVHPPFFSYLWSSPAVRREIEERARTAAGIYKINTGNLTSLPLRLPVLAAQRRIAADLAPRQIEADRLAATLRSELAAIEALPALLLRLAFGVADAA